MCDFAQKFGCVSFLLQWITLVRATDNGHFFCNEFPILTFPLRLDQRTTDSNGSTRVQSLYRPVIRQSISGDDLEIAQARSIVQLDKRKVLRIPAGPYPSPH